MHTMNDEIDYSQYLNDRDGQKIREASTWADEVIDRISGKAGATGDLLPWSKTHAHVQLRRGELSIWAGINGHGKSLVIGQTMLWLLPSTRVLIASMEMKPEATIERMLRQAAGTHYPAEEWVRQFMTWTDDKLWIYDQLDSVQADKILGMVTYAAEQLSIQHVVIDSLMKCGMAPDDYAAQKRFVDKLCWVAKSTGIHIHLVVHMRKRDREGQAPDKFDIKGAGEITDLADNVFIVHRNKDKEEALRIGKEQSPEAPDATLAVAKQRHGEWEGKIALWFDAKSNQFIPKPNAGAMLWPTPETHFTLFSSRDSEQADSDARLDRPDRPLRSVLTRTP